MGLSFANQVNPAGQGAGSPLTTILEQLAIVLFFGIDGHHILLGVLEATFVQYPISGWVPQLAVPRLTAGAAAAEEWGLLLAAPVAFCLFLTTLVLALLGRVAPQLGHYVTGFPLRLGVGLTASILLLPGWVNAMVSVFAHFGNLATQWM
jgi:flagellar biosynthetic protein FliR